MNAIGRLLSVLLSLSITNVYALESKVDVQEVELKEKKSSPWHIFGGLASGYGSVSSQEYSGSIGGQQFLVSGLVSYQIPKWVFDGGLSWIYSRVGGLDSQNIPVEI